MRRRWNLKLLIVSVALLAAPATLNQFGGLRAAAAGQPQEAGGREEPDLPEREEFRQSYQLSEGGRVEVANISGSVEIEATDGTAAEVHIIHSTRRRSDLACHRLTVEHTSTALIVRPEAGQRSCNGVSIRQRVMLKVPRRVDILARGISGPVQVGETDSAVRLSGLSGRVKLAQGRGYSEVTGVSGHVTITVARLGERGLRVSGTSGPVELRLAGDVNADLRVSGLSGDLSIEHSNVTLNRVGSSSYQGRVGSGGAPISVTGSSGRITIRDK